MVINQNGSSKSIPVNTLNTIIDQISALQEDLALLQSNVAGFANSFSTGSLDTNHADITTATIGTENVGTANINNATITNLNASTGAITNLNVSGTLKASAITGATNVNATNFSGVTINGNTVNAGSLNVTNNISAKGLTLTEDIEARNISGSKIIAPTINTVGINSNAIVTETIKANTKVDTETMNASYTNTGDINILGTANINGELNTDTISTESLFVDNIRLYKDLNKATPALDGNDTYTVLVSDFTGTVNLLWENGEGGIVWSAIVSSAGGNGYNVIWKVYVDGTLPKIYVDNGLLYFVTNANGGLRTSAISSTTISEPVIYYNMLVPEDAEYVIDVDSKIGSALFQDKVVIKNTDFDSFIERIDKIDSWIQTIKGIFVDSDTTTIENLNVVGDLYVKSGVLTLGETEVSIDDTLDTSWIKR